MRNIAILMMMLSCLSAIAQQNRQDSIVKNELRNAFRLLRNVDSPEKQSDAFQIYLHHASLGNTHAMNVVASLYRQGIGTGKSFDKALQWYEKAAKLNSKIALASLARIYKNGLGVESDPSKVYGYADRLSSLGDSKGHYMKGYLLYKGLGCKQDYSKAFIEFKAGAEKKNPLCIYMAGICYRNGYGVDRDTEKAEQYLTQAKKQGSMDSLEELMTEQPENPLEVLCLGESEVESSVDISTFPSVAHQRLQTSVQPIAYKGSLITYDWSGKYILSITPLDAELSIDGDEISGSWTEGDSLEIRINGIQTDSCILFNDVRYNKAERDFHGKELDWVFKDARMRSYKIGDEHFLTGNIRQYAPKLCEFGRPMYVMLKSVSENETDLKKNGMVFPNPFINEFSVCINPDMSGDVTITIHSFTGVFVYQKVIKAVSEGEHCYTIPANFPSGQYIVKVQYGAQVYTYPVQKQ